MNEIQKKQPFAVPEGYFETLPDKIMKQIQDLPPAQHSPSKVLLIRKQLAFAAAFIGFFLLSYGVFKFITSTLYSSKQNHQVAQLTYEEAILYEVGENELIEVLALGNNETYIDPESIENYLIDDNIHDQMINE